MNNQPITIHQFNQWLLNNEPIFQIARDKDGIPITISQNHSGWTLIRVNGEIKLKTLDKNKAIKLFNDLTQPVQDDKLTM